MFDPKSPGQYVVAETYSSDTEFNQIPNQRWLVFKVDTFVLTFASLGYFLKNIDQTNVNNAFLSGMKEDLNMYGNELVTSTSIWSVGYVIGQIPSNLLLTRVSPRSGFYPGIYYMLGSWYTPREIGKRSMIFWLAGSVGNMFSGFLQAAAYKNLSGVHGHAGWRWLFIIDGIITIPLALMDYIFFPNLPESGKKTWWTTEKEHHLSPERMKAVGRVGKQPWTKAKVRSILLSWHTYLLPLLYIIWNNGAPQAGMGYWLKSFNAHPPPVPGRNYTVPQINNLPLPNTAIFVVMALSWGWLSDGPLKGARWPFIYAGAIITMIFHIALLKMPLYTGTTGRMVVYWFANIGMGAGPLILGWINEICSADTEKRALLVAMANDLAYVVQAVAPNFVWKTTAFPAARKGYIWVISLQGVLIVVTATIQSLLWRDEQKAQAETDNQAVETDNHNVVAGKPSLKG
ncbi:MFS general substrate transporter, partial [Aureobasidium melanogenum]